MEMTTDDGADFARLQRFDDLLVVGVHTEKPPNALLLPLGGIIKV